MRRAAVILLLVFACAMYVAAQQAGTGSQSYPSSSGQTGSQAGAAGQTGAQTGEHAGMHDKSGKKEKSVMGCLQKSPTGGDTYVLQSKDQGNIQIEPFGRLKDEIGKHVGHEVRLIGKWEKTGEGATKAEGGAAAGAQPSGQTAETRPGEQAGQKPSEQAGQAGQAGLPQSDQPTTGQAGGRFKADRLDMIAESCTEGAK